MNMKTSIIFICCIVAMARGKLNEDDDIPKYGKDPLQNDATLFLSSAQVPADLRSSRSAKIKPQSVASSSQASSSSPSSSGASEKTVAMLTRQLMMQQMIMEEKVRSDGDSGIKQVRQGKSGSRPYYTATHVGNAPAAMHDHADFASTIGMGEVTAVLNGVEFRTRHNDYKLKMPHRTSRSYEAVEDIPFPEVPPNVTEKASVQDQIDEMREWFKAWKDQDHSVRDYRRYFKPVLCYLEGAWTYTKAQIDEPFFSERHSIDASTWFELQNKVEFTTYTGKKSALENYAYLPTKIMGISNDSTPIIAQWNYRILCQPLNRDLPLNRFRLVDDLKTRVAQGYTPDELKNSRAARFRLNPYDNDRADKEGFIRYGLLDELMYSIPGKDNQQANITDDAFYATAYDVSPDSNGETLNAGFYHRFSKANRKDAMGQQFRKNGYSDDNLFVALNTQDRVAGRSVEQCKGRRRRRVCKTWEQKVSYAIPLEVIYLTPLSNWDPYNLKKNLTDSDRGKNYFITPAAFFRGDEVDSTSADTSRNSRKVTDQSGKTRYVRASGIRIILPNIEGVGIMRQRYPIMPVHAEGSVIWKELEALREIVLNPKNYAHLMNQDDDDTDDENATTKSQGLKLEMTLSRVKKTAAHKHKVVLSAEQVAKLKKGELVTVTSSEAIGHSHTIQIRYRTKGGNKTKYYYQVVKCDNADKCWDRHGKYLTVMSS